MTQHQLKHDLFAGDEQEECPSNDFKSGQPSGQCWGDGHYRCSNCSHYRADFKSNGQDYIDWMHTRQGGLLFNSLNILVN